jgi:hypothetical protein
MVLISPAAIAVSSFPSPVAPRRLMLGSAVFFFTYGLSIILNGTGVVLQVSLHNGPSGGSGEA